MIAVADTSPIVYLVLIEEIELLPVLFTEVVVPLGVAAELSEPRAPEALRRWWDEPLGWVMLWMRHATRGELRVEAVQRRGWVREVRTRASSAGT